MEGKNPHHRGTATELVIEQNKRHQEATQNVERSITDKVRTFVGGWTCPVCGKNTRFDNYCTACDYALDPVKQSPKHSQKSQKSNKMLTNILGSLRGTFGNKPNHGTSVDKSDKLVLVTNKGGKISDQTISPSFLQENEERFPKLNLSPEPSLDSGHCTMSDTTSQIDQPTSEIEEDCSSPIACSEATAQSSWTCPTCKAVNLATIGQHKCYVCNIGTAPVNIVPLLPSQDRRHTNLEITNNDPRLHNPQNQASTHKNDSERIPSFSSPKMVSKEPVQCDGPTLKISDIPKQRPSKLTHLHVMEANNNPTQLQRRSIGDECCPSPAKNCTQLMVVKLREEATEADKHYKEIRESCLKVGKMLGLHTCTYI